MRFDDDKTLYDTIGKNIKEYRLRCGFTQIQLAEKADISLSYITKIEARNCNKSISLSVVNHLANILEVEIEDLFKEDIDE